MAIAFNRVARTVGRTATIAALSTAMLGGALGAGIASAENGATYYQLTSEADTSPRMHFFTSAVGGKATPGYPVKVGVYWDLWNLWDAFPSKQSQQSQINFLQDIIKIGAWQNSTVTIDGQDCDKYGPGKGVDAVEGGRQDGLNIEPVDILGFVGQARNLLASIGSETFLSKFTEFLSSRVQATCTFNVPKNVDTNILIGGKVDLHNLFGALNKNYEGKAYLPVAVQKEPNAPVISAKYNIVAHKSDAIEGMGDPGTLVNWNIDGVDYSSPTVPVGTDGRWKIKLPPAAPADGSSVPAKVRSSLQGSTVGKDSATHNLRVIPDLAKPAITDPATGPVAPGQTVTVSGSEGAKATPVDKAGNPVGTTSTIKDGTAQVALNKDLKPGAEIQIRATDDATVNPHAEFSDWRTVKSDAPEPRPVYQAGTPVAAPGAASALTVAVQPANGDLSSLAGKTMTVTAPADFTFRPLAGERYNVTASAGDKDDKNNGLSSWLGDSVKVSPDGKKMTITLPGAEELKRIIGNSQSIKIGVTVVATADANASAGEKTGGGATVDGIGTTDLKGKVS
ncbi:MULTISPECIES: hypothetical protein [Actinomycetes]|uniref:hypothetical protein n=1 Tax=Actinomycetes TaxID=1760 RepID=UPI001319FBA1|nr:MULTISPECIES: hypothetical protein [Actinomycetes]